MATNVDLGFGVSTEFVGNAGTFGNCTTIDTMVGLAAHHDRPISCCTDRCLSVDDPSATVRLWCCLALQYPR